MDNIRTYYSNPLATLCLFAYGDVTIETHGCIIQELANWPNLFYRVAGDDALISRVRSKVASTFLLKERAGTGDVLLMVDHDVQWQEGDLGYIARKALEYNAIVGGICPRRAFNQGIPVRFAPNTTEQHQIGTDAVIPAQYVGGFFAIPKSIIKAVADTLPRINEGYYPLFLPMVVENTLKGVVTTEYLSEDWSFCHRAIEIGGKVMIAFKPRLQHRGRYTYRIIDNFSHPLENKDMNINLI